LEKSFERKHTIGYFEVDGNLNLMPSTLMVHLQDTAILHSDSLGYTLDYLAEKKQGWAVLNWHIIITRLPKCGETISILTWANRCRRMQAERSYCLRDEAGEEVVRVASRWVFMDLEAREVMPLSEEMQQRYGDGAVSAIEGEKFIMPKVKTEEALVLREFVVTRRDTDTNGHTNNVKYIEWAMDDVPDEIYDEMRLEDLKVVYRKECYRGTKVTARTYVRKEEEKRQVITFLEEAEQIFAQVVTSWKRA